MKASVRGQVEPLTPRHEVDVDRTTSHEHMRFDNCSMAHCFFICVFHKSPRVFVLRMGICGVSAVPSSCWFGVPRTRKSALLQARYHCWPWKGLE